jgi:lipopolysaccharide export system protein LptA
MFFKELMPPTRQSKLMNPVKLFLVLICLIPLSASALTSDKSQPIQIEADRLEIDETKHISHYQGNVEMTQGSLSFTADSIIFHFDENNDLQWLQVEGKPAHFKQLNDDETSVSGSALRMNYYQPRSELELLGQARFQSVLDTIESESITINTDTDALQAGGEQGKGRVRMLIQPKKNE